MIFYNLSYQQADLLFSKVGKGEERQKVSDNSKLSPNMNFPPYHTLFVIAGTYSQMKMWKYIIFPLKILKHIIFH